MEGPIDTERKLPVTLQGVENFLASPYTEGIGKVYASRIAETLGVEAVEKILDDPNVLKDIPGLGEGKIITLIDSLKALKYPLDLTEFLYSCSLSDTDVEKILTTYKDLTRKIILYDPYEMVEDAWKLSFFTADKIGKGLGIVADDTRRLRGALLTAVKIYAEMGHVFATEDQAIKMASRISGVDERHFAEEIANLVADGRLIRSRDGIYLPVYYKAEKGAAQKLASLIASCKPFEKSGTVARTDRDGHKLSGDQLNAINTVMYSPVTVITGGPGTGKTTAVKGIIDSLEQQGKDIILAAPTGRAAKRMSDLTGREATTLHRLLGYRPTMGYKNKKLQTDILIIDEGSMLEQVMFNHLLQAVAPGTKIVIVGDTDQLPPIGAGDVLRNLIESGTVPVVRLNENFRQAEGSMIAHNANSIRQGIVPKAGKQKDFEILLEDSASKVHATLMKVIKETIPEKYGVLPRDIQVVSPQQEGPLGTKLLNVEIQQAVNPEGPCVRRGAKILRVGDRVMQTSNSSQRNVYNGETGWISEVDILNQAVEVTFTDGKTLWYDRKDLGQLSLAYAITVHKMQGSETDFMVMPLILSHRLLLYRNLLYTAVSRARKLCVIVADEKALTEAVSNDSPVRRNSNFGERLRDLIPG